MSEGRFDKLDFLDTIRTAVLSVRLIGRAIPMVNTPSEQCSYCPPCYLANNDMYRLQTISLLESPSSKIHTC